jgi:hypothetical protein
MTRWCFIDYCKPLSRGLGVEKNYRLAKTYLTPSANEGDAEAIALLTMVRTCAACGARPASSSVCQRCLKVGQCRLTVQYPINPKP